MSEKKAESRISATTSTRGTSMGIIAKAWANLFMSGLYQIEPV